MASKPDNRLQSLPTFFDISSRPWWEKLFFPWRLRRRIAKQLLRILEIGSNRNFSAWQLACDMGLNDIEGQCIIDEALRYLLLKGKIEQIYPGKFHLRDFRRVTGVIDLSVPDKPILISGNARRPIYLLQDCLHGAIHGDTVIAHVCWGANNSLEAEVLRIIKFAQRRMVGDLEVLEHRAFFTPTNRYLFRDIEIPLNRIKDAINGDRVVVELDIHVQKNKTLTGKVIRVLGEAGLECVESASKIEKNGFSVCFSAEQEEAAAAFTGEISEAEIANRLDLRSVCTFTIDPEGTKDIDDALSIRTLENGNWEIGIHIADVTHFIKSGSVLDKNAYERATSVYLPDKILPLFPDNITQLCSFAPQIDKLAFSVLLEMDDEARVVGREIVKTIIHSDCQFSYDEAQRLLDSTSGKFYNEMKTLQKLATELKCKRRKNGAIFFDESPHLRFEFNEMGVTEKVELCKRNDAMKLVEEFMLLANRTVAETMAKQHKPFLYRTHSMPNIKMFEELCRVAANYGYLLKSSTARVVSMELNKLLKAVARKPEEALFANLAVRCMARGKYSMVPRRHFALSFDHYTHFTSPIRRYADVIVHRLVAKNFVDVAEQTSIFDYDRACSHINFMCEKAKVLQDYSERQKCAEFLQNKIGEEFTGVIAHITPVMMTVQLKETGIRGRVKISSLDGQYRMDTKMHVINGGKKGDFYRVGNKVKVQLLRANVSSGLVDFRIIEKIEHGT